MNAMQYTIKLADDFDMNEIRKRVKENGHKTDGFEGLRCKVYLISENKEGEEGKNIYAPLYIWNQSEGMNTFIFEGFYDNILQSFGWQQIQIGIPLHYEIKNEFMSARYVQVFEHNISQTIKMQKPAFSNEIKGYVGRLLIYNPDKWKYSVFYFFKNKQGIQESFQVYEILHISM